MKNRPPRYVVCRAVRTRKGGDPDKYADLEWGWFATYRRGTLIGPDFHLVGYIRWGSRGRRLAERDACKLHRKWAKRLHCDREHNHPHHSWCDVDDEDNQISPVYICDGRVE